MRLAVILASLTLLNFGGAGAQPAPVIDMHLHSYTAIPAGMKAVWADRPDSQSLTTPASAEEHLRATLEEMDRHNIVLAVVSGPEASIRAWHDAAPGRFIGGAFLGDDGLPEHSVDSLRKLVDEGVIGVLGELGLQYYGIAPTDERLHPYYDYLEESGVPLALHTGLGPPGAPYALHPEFRTALGRPALFEAIKVNRPQLKAYLMHAGWPYIEETKAMLYVYPDLYADIGVMTWVLTREAFYDALRELVEAGFGDRLLFGTDQMMWPDAVSIAIETVQAAHFLTESQKRDIFYNNAARFLGLSEAQIAAHHAQ